LTILVGFYPRDQPASATHAAERMKMDMLCNFELSAIRCRHPENATLDRFRARKPILVDLNARAFDAG